MSSTQSFVELALAGEIVDPEDELEEYVEKWHEGGTGQDLHDWLGFSWEEYAVWVEQPDLLRAILMARQTRVPLKQAITFATGDTARIAARGVPPEDIPRIREWLERTGRL